MVRSLLELKNENEDARATEGRRKQRWEDSQVRALSLREKETGSAMLTLPRSFPECLTNTQGRQCSQAPEEGPVNDPL